MAWRIKSVTLSASWDITGSVTVTPETPETNGLFGVAEVSFSVTFGGVGAGGSVTLSGKEDYLPPGGSYATRNVSAAGDSDTSTGLGSPEIDLAGSVSVSVPAYLCFEYGGTGSASPFANGVVDTPPFRKLRLFLVGAGDATATASIAGVSASGSVDVRGVTLSPAGAAQATATTYGGESSTATISVTLTDGGYPDGPNTTATDTGTDFAGLTGMATSTAGGGSAAATASDGATATSSVGWNAPRSFSITGAIYAFDQPYPGSLTIGCPRYAGDTIPNITVTGGTFSRSAVQRFYGVSASAAANGGANDYQSKSMDTFATVGAGISQASLIALGDEPLASRLMMRGWSDIPGIGLSQASSFTIDDMGDLTGGKLSITGPATGTRTYSTERSFGSYRYLRIKLRSVGSASEATQINLGGYAWNLTTGADGTYIDRDIDLCSPDSASGDALNDAWDTRFPVPTVTSATSGPFRVGSVTFTGVASGKTIEVDSMTLVRVNPPTVDFCPTLYPSKYYVPAPPADPYVEPEWPDVAIQNEDRSFGTGGDGVSSDWVRRFVLANSDGRQTVEEPDLFYTRSVTPSGVTSYSFNSLSVSALASQINDNGDLAIGYAPWNIGTDPAGGKARWPGWTATVSLPAPAAFVPAFSGDVPPKNPYYYNADSILATELMGQGAYYDGGFTLGWDRSLTDGVPAQNLFDAIDLIGVGGDIFGHGGSGGGESVSLVCAAILRAQSHGLVLNPDTGDPVSGAGVHLRQGSTTVGTGTSRADGWYHTSGASAKPPGADISVRPAAGGDAVALGKSYTRHRHRGSFIIVPAGTPAHSPRGLNTNQGGYYASVVIRGEPRKGRVQFRRTDGPQVPLPGGFPWSVVSFVSAPGTNQGDEEPWVWYDRKDGGLHILYTRAAYDPDDPGAPPTDTRVREAVSFDDGATWSETEYTGMARRPHSMTEPGASGATLRAWYVPGNPSDTDDTNHGTIVGTFQSAGMPAQSAPFTFREYVSGSYTPLIVHDDVFGLTYAHESQGRYNLVVMIKGEGEPANFHSSDDGQTWSRVAGTGGGTEIDTMGIDDELFGG